MKIVILEFFVYVLCFACGILWAQRSPAYRVSQFLTIVAGFCIALALLFIFGRNWE